MADGITFIGLDVQAATITVAGAGDLRRFRGAPAFMAHTGNAHLRFVLVEASWHYGRHRPKTVVIPQTEVKTLPLASVPLFSHPRL